MFISLIDDKLADDNQYDPNTVAQGELGNNNRYDGVDGLPNNIYDTNQDNHLPFDNNFAQSSLDADKDLANEATQAIPDSQEGEYMMCTWDILYIIIIIIDL